jgi:hypothetical protein
LPDHSADKCHQKQSAPIAPTHEVETNSKQTANTISANGKAIASVFPNSSGAPNSLTAFSELRGQAIFRSSDRENGEKNTRVKRSMISISNCPVYYISHEVLPVLQKIPMIAFSKFRIINISS